MIERVPHRVLAPALGTEAMRMFCLIILAALSLAVIITSLAFHVADVSASLRFYLMVLVATGCVAIPIAGLAAQYDGQVRTLQDVTPSDDVTGLSSPKFIELTIEYERRKAGDMPPSAAVFMFEIDHIQHIQDLRGEPLANHAIKWVSEQVMSRLRAPHDKLARVEHATFIGVLKGVSLDQAERICQRLHQEIGEATLDAGPGGQILTLSFGVAPFLPGYSFAEASAEAFIALKDARRFGRDQVRSRYIAPVLDPNPTFGRKQALRK